MKHAADAVIRWILDWAAIIGAAWVLAILAMITAFHRSRRSQPAMPVPPPLQADAAIGYLDVRAMLDAPDGPWTPADMDILAGRRLP